MPVFQPFHMERMMSRLEKEVEYNLSESGAHPVMLRNSWIGRTTICKACWTPI